MVAGVFGYLAFKDMNWGDAWEAMKTANPVWMLLGVLALGIDYSLRVIRWWIMMRPVSPELKASECFGPFLASIAMNNVLPFRAGDIARAFAFQKLLKVNPAKTLGTMLVERLLDLVTLLGFLYIGLALAGPGKVDQGFIAMAGVLAAVGGFMLIGCVAFPGLFLKWSENAKEKAEAKGGGFVGKVAGLCIDLFGTLKAMQNPATLGSLLVLSVTAWFLEGCLFVCGLLALAPDAPFVSGWFALATGTLATLIPSTPGYVGTFDLMTKLAYEAFGVNSSLAGIAALLVHVLIWVPLTLAGGGWLLFSATARQRAAVENVVEETV